MGLRIQPWVWTQQHKNCLVAGGSGPAWSWDYLDSYHRVGVAIWDLTSRLARQKPGWLCGLLFMRHFLLPPPGSWVLAFVPPLFDHMSHLYESSEHRGRLWPLPSGPLLGAPVPWRFHEGLGDDSSRLLCSTSMEATKPQERKRTILRVTALAVQQSRPCLWRLCSAIIGFKSYASWKCPIVSMSHNVIVPFVYNSDLFTPWERCNIPMESCSSVCFP